MLNAEMARNFVLGALVVSTVVSAQLSKVANEHGLSGFGSESFKEISFREPYSGHTPRVYCKDTTVTICRTNSRGSRQCFTGR